jgi:hypothetical protein
MILALYAYLLPTLLYVLWTTLALWDLGRRADTPTAKVWLWGLAIFALPFVGALAYLFVGGATLAPRVKLLALGGTGAYLVVLALGASLGGIS